MMFRIIKLNLIQLRRRLFLLLVIAVVFAMLSFAFAGAMAESMQSEMGDIHLDIAVTSDGDENTILTDFVSGMSDISEYASFVPMNMEKAEKSLENGEITAILSLPDGFMDSILSGENMPMTLYIDSASRAEGLLVLYAGSCAGDMLISVQKAIYSVIDELRSANALGTGEILKINMKYISFTTNRANMFETEIVSATGSVGIFEHYVSSMIITILLMTATLFYPIFDINTAWKRRLKSVGYSGFNIAISCFMTVFICMLALSVALVFLCSGFNIVAIFALSFALSALICLVCSMATGEVFCSIFAFILAIAMAFFAGGIVPPILLPESVLQIMPYVPLTAMRSAMIGDTGILIFAYALIFAVLAIYFTVRRFDRG